MKSKLVSLFITISFFISCDLLIVEPDMCKEAYQEEFSELIEIEDQGVFILENKNGSINIVGSDTIKSISLEITKEVRSDNLEDAKAHMKDILITKQIDEEKVFIEVDHPDIKDRNYVVDLKITLPWEFDITLHNGNGNAALSSSRGNLILKVGNGNINLKKGMSTNISFNLGNGNITAGVVITDVKGVTMKVGNGTLKLEIPRDIDAKVKATIGNGTIKHSGLNLKNLSISRTYLKGFLGEGKGYIVLDVGNGSIELRGG